MIRSSSTAQAHTANSGRPRAVLSNLPSLRSAARNPDHITPFPHPTHSPHQLLRPPPPSLRMGEPHCVVWENATLHNATNATTSADSVLFEPSIPMCIGLSTFGGLLEVASTMCLAYPEFREKMGDVYSKCFHRAMMAMNLLLMLVASIAYIVGSWYGPVSLSVPTVMVSKLLFNLLIMGVVLRMDRFSKDQQVGTYCIACAILTLPEVGPTDQPGADVLALVRQPLSIAWISVLTLATFVCCGGMVVLSRRTEKPGMLVSLGVYVLAQVVSAVMSTSVSKMFPLLDGLLLLILFLLLAGVFAIINVVSLILAAKAVDQALFVPATVMATIVFNMITGIIIWEDWRVIHQWTSYAMAHLIMLLGIFLLAPADAMEQYKNKNRRLSIITDILGTSALRASTAESTESRCISHPSSDSSQPAKEKEVHLSHINPTLEDQASADRVEELPTKSARTPLKRIVQPADVPPEHRRTSVAEAWRATLVGSPLDGFEAMERAAQHSRVSFARSYQPSFAFEHITRISRLSSVCPMSPRARTSQATVSSHVNASSQVNASAQAEARPQLT
ncbi:hypothetical protein AB1Y20_005517 [Prymnesium parvum]|uniref:Transmembrane protein n=1 Tax=Prymnesium parvum TaxID=97485 RepID=A0AB34J6G8_PRYPA